MKYRLIFRWPVNKDAFSSVFLLLNMPLILILLSFIVQLCFRLTLQNRLRFACVNESLTLQRQLFTLSNNSSDSSSYRIYRKEAAAQLRSRLQALGSGTDLHVEEYPQTAHQLPAITRPDLAYNLKLSTAEGTFSLHCGARVIKDGVEWKLQVISETIVGKF